MKCALKTWTIFALVTFALVTVACASTYIDRRNSSPHFSKGKFHNPKKNSKSFWKFLKMRWSEDYSIWPDWVNSNYMKVVSQRVRGDEVHITHINHSTVLIQTQGLNIITDPIYSERCSPVSWAGPKRVRNPGVKFEDLPPIDVVIISHDHYDHLDLPTIESLQKRDRPKFYMGLGVGKRFDFTEGVFEMDWWDQQQHSEVLKINFVPVQHFSGRGLFDRNSTLWGGFVLEVKGKKIYFGGDTGYAEHFVDTEKKFGQMDISMIPIGAYEPRWFMSYAHVNPKEAVQAHIDLKSKLSIGIHYGTFQLTAEKITAPVEHLNLAMKDMTSIATRSSANPSPFLALEFGKTMVIQP